MKDYYRILGLEKNASLSEIKKAYRRLAVKFHPDKNLDDDGFFEKMFKDITEAYDILSDMEKRNEYDNNSFYKENQKSSENQQNDYDDKDEEESQTNRNQQDDYAYADEASYEYQEERDTASDESQNDSSVGIGGWLYVFSFWMIILGAGSILELIYTFNGGIGNLNQDIVRGLLDSHTIKEIISYKRLAFLYNVATIIDTIIVLNYILLFFSKDRHFIYFFSLEIIYFMIYQSFFYFNNLQNVEFLPSLAFNISILILSNLYFRNSKRVLNTFIH
tara:strand:- start:55 stop:882 length:828 start_codon:yes stop_codon:yes gene_type:complete